MHENPAKTSKTLTAPQRKAAVLVAEDELTDEQIAADVGVSTRTLYYWKGLPAFQAAAADHRQRIAASISRHWIAKRVKRVQRLQDLAEKAIAVIEQRAADPRMAEAPGGNTGLMTHTVKVVGYGETSEAVDVFTVDTALMAEIRNTMKQAAQEVGQWSEKHEVTKDSEELTQVLFVLPVKGSQPPIFPKESPE